MSTNPNDVVLGFEIDTSGLKAASTAAKQAMSDVGGLGDAQEELSRKSREAALSGRQLADQLEAERRAAANLTRQQQLLDKALADGRITTDQHSRSTRELADHYKSAINEMRRAGTAAEGFGGKARELSGNIRLNQGDLQNLLNTFRGQGGLTGTLDSAGGLLGRFGGSLSTTTLLIGGAAVAVGGLAAGYHSMNMYLATYQDHIVQIEGRLRNSLGSYTAARRAIDGLFESTQRMGTGFDSAADAFQRIARNNASIGLMQAEMLQMVETVQMLAVASGASTGEMQAGMVQFGQALASGRLQGDELRSIMENFPALAKAIADNFEQVDGTIGISIGSLRRMGSEGELTGMKIAQSVLRASKTAKDEFDKMPETVARANQRIEDSWTMLLAGLGKRFESSEYGQWYLGKVHAVTDRVREAVAEMDDPDALYTRQENYLGYLERAAARKGGDGGRYAIQADRVRERMAEMEAAHRAATLEKLQADAEERINKLATEGQSGIDNARDLKSLDDRRKGALATVEQLERSIAAYDEAIKAGGSKDHTVEDLRLNQQKAQARLELARRALESVMGQLGSIELANADAFRARGLGGFGGEDFVRKAITAQRADAKMGAGGSLDAYISGYITQEMQRNEERIAQMQRATANQERMLQTLGQGRAQVREAEIEIEVEKERMKFGNLDTRPDVIAWLTRYEQALRSSKQAADEAADAQKLFNVRQSLRLSRMLRDAGGNPREEAEVRLEYEIEQGRRGFSNETDADEWELARRAQFSNDRKRDEQASVRSYQIRRQMLAEESKLIALSNEEYRVQSALLQKRNQLMQQGYKGNEPFYHQELKRTESLAREEARADAEQQARGRFIGTLDKSVDGFEDSFISAMDAVFQHGAEAGRDVFGNQMSDVIRRMGAELTYEIAVRPFEEFMRQLVRIAATKLFSMIFGGQAGGSSFSFGDGYSYDLGGSARVNNARGNSFSGPISTFAKGGAFTNAIVTAPTMFRFGRGAGLMGEAGPEAIMPLGRDSAGRLGVHSGGGGQSVVNVYDMRSAPNSDDIEIQHRQRRDGMRQVDVLVRDGVKKHIRSGSLDNDMAATYGQRRQITRR